ncbi:MAG TPA: hypothetical protein VN372_12575 [Methanospirillum sp.]|nr:hypothetical protein [Methanospirillum sp.]
MRRLFIVLILLLVTISLMAGQSSATVFLKNGTEIDGPETLNTILDDINTTGGSYSITFFYNTHCGACHLAMAFLEQYKATHPDIRIGYYDLFNSTANKTLFEQFKTDYNRRYVAVPSVFIGNAGLEGESAISTYFDPLVTWYTENDQGIKYSADLSEPRTPPVSPTSFSLPLILFAGLVDGINPCAFAVLIFLLIYLMSIQRRSRILITGAAFTSAVFIFYFLSGIGILAPIQTTGVVTGFSLFAGAVSLITGVMVIKDAIIPGIGPSLTIPESKKEMVNRYIEQTTIPVAFILGLLVSMFEIPCTGGVYIKILALISQHVPLPWGFLYLMAYNLAFIVPLLIIITLVYWGFPEEEVNEWSIMQQRGLKLFIGLLMIVFAVLILSGVL